MSAFANQWIKLKFVRWSASGPIGIDDVANNMGQSNSYTRNGLVMIAEPEGATIAYSWTYRGTELWFENNGMNRFARHEHTLSIYPLDDGNQARYHYMTMELFHGGSLQFNVPNSAWDPTGYFNPADERFVGGRTDSYTYGDYGSVAYSPSTATEAHPIWGWANCSGDFCYETYASNDYLDLRDHDTRWPVWP